jgi:hypothetical protein
LAPLTEPRPADIAAAKAQRPEIEAIFERYGIR